MRHHDESTLQKVDAAVPRAAGGSDGPFVSAIGAHRGKGKRRRESATNRSILEEGNGRVPLRHALSA